ncbi:MAG TPA: metallopeptidase TldD-related protein [Kofleriaceae bacterium]|nr:metallopeptidase TldD-related protein [Kofleriaceae bacterium]
MAGWSRREVMAALAAGAAGAAVPGWAGLLGCGGARPAPAAAPAPPPMESIAGLRAQLRSVAADLGRRFRRVAVRAELGQLTSVRVEAEDRALEQRGRTSLSLAGFDGRSWTELVGEDLSPDAIARAAAALVIGRGAAAARAAPIPTAAAVAAKSGASDEVPGPRMRLDPRARPASEWLDRAAQLHDRAGRVGGSRLVYRAASLEVDDSEVIFVGDGRDLAQRLVRARARALFLAWTGAALVGEEASRSGAFGLEVAQLADSQLERAATGALTLFTSGTVVPGARDLVLDPSVAALLVRHGARGLEADAWARGGARASALAGRTAGAAIVTVRDDPTADACYGGYRFDDEGWPAAPVAIIERGAVRGPLCDEAGAAALGRPRTGHGRRAGPRDPVEARPSHLVLEPGTRTLDQLIAAIDGQGYLVESGIDGSGDGPSWRVAIRARRAREIEGGRLTGRVYGPVVVAGDVPALLGAVRGVGRDVEAHGWREPSGDGALALSAAAPSMLTRGWLGGS